MSGSFEQWAILELMGHVRLRGLCWAFDIPWAYSSIHRSSTGADYGYTVEAGALRNQLQRLRRGGKVRNNGYGKREVRGQ